MGKRYADAHAGCNQVYDLHGAHMLGAGGTQECCEAQQGSKQRTEK